MPKCATCDQEHSLETIEPAFRRPDDYVKLSPEEQEGRAKASDDLCRIDDPHGGMPRYFVRSTMSFRVADREKPFRWGVWAEISEADFRDVLDLWSDPDQSAHVPIDATLANQIPNYELTLGMPCKLHLVDERTRPDLRPLPAATGRFASQYRNGISEETALSWVHAFA